MPERRRIAVTGIGPVTPIGTGVDDFWAGLVAGRSGAGPI
ncbi:MAG TPA: beta-ketoacyl synthase N-terminal-like domain-containing protein, partial [Actinomycetota bacterium]|nr:beta-ketoacyl synthase N-terminal-like domain-containing protein [Actinomycetota bacterium]